MFRIFKFDIYSFSEIFLQFDVLQVCFKDAEEFALVAAKIKIFNNYEAIFVTNAM